MTLQGKTNHYGIKYLRGFSLALRMDDKRVLLRNGTDLLTSKHEDETWFVNQLPYERIIISGKGFISTEAIKRLSKNNVNIILLDTFGNYISNISRVMSSDIGTKNRIGQYDTFRDFDKVCYLQNQLVKAKLTSHINLLKEFKLDKAKELEGYLRQVDGTKDKRELFTIESRAANLYFRQYVKLFDKKYNFESRRGGGLVMANKKASNVINALLNYGYAVLAGEIAKFIQGFGLDPYFGFYHKTDTSFQSLVYDVIEPFRWLVDYTVAKIAGETNHNKPIRKYEYTWTGEGEIILSDGLIKRYLEELSRKFESERLYSFNHGLKRKDGLSMCQEITIAKITIDRLTRYCTGKTNIFEI
jgi:CRISP-associated protein Cas1